MPNHVKSLRRTKMRTLLSVPLLLLFAAVVSGEEDKSEAVSRRTETSTDTLSHEDSLAIGLASPNRAFTYSMLGTFAPIPTLFLAVPGVIVGPSLGYFHAGMSGRGMAGIGIRVVGIGGMLSSFAICGWDCGPGDSNYDLAWAVFLGSGGIVVGSAVYDLATLKRHVRIHNAQLLNPRSLSVRPVYFPNARAFGASLQLRF